MDIWSLVLTANAPEIKRKGLGRPSSEWSSGMLELSLINLSHEISGVPTNLKNTVKYLELKCPFSDA